MGFFVLGLTLFGGFSVLAAIAIYIAIYTGWQVTKGVSRAGYQAYSSRQTSQASRARGRDDEQLMNSLVSSHTTNPYSVTGSASAAGRKSVMEGYLTWVRDGNADNWATFAGSLLAAIARRAFSTEQVKGLFPKAYAVEGFPEWMGALASQGL